MNELNYILNIFASYTDMYLTYMNDFISANYFCEYYDIKRIHFDIISDIVQKELKPNNLPFTCLDFYVNRHIYELKLKND